MKNKDIIALKFILWVVSAFPFYGLVFNLINARDTVFNMLGVLLLILHNFISFRTQCFTKIKFS